MRYPAEDDQSPVDKRLIFHGQCLYQYTSGLLEVVKWGERVGGGGSDAGNCALARQRGAASSGSCNHGRPE